MAKFELKLPKMGESVAEATITSWLKNVGDVIEADEAVLEIATDKVDSEVPSEVDGVLVEKFFEVDDVVQVGQTIAVIEVQGEGSVQSTSIEKHDVLEVQDKTITSEILPEVNESKIIVESTLDVSVVSNEERFYSPLVRNIAKKEKVTQDELDAITGSGSEGRVTKNDILAYLKNRVHQSSVPPVQIIKPIQSNGISKVPTQSPEVNQVQPIISSGEDEIIEMDRMRKLISSL